MTDPLSRNTEHGKPRPSGPVAQLCLAITELDIGGAERTFVELAVRLRERGWPVGVVCLQPPGSLAQYLADHAIAVESLNIRRGWNVLPGLRKWIRLLRRDRPQLLQTFLFHANILGRLAGRLARTPVIVGGVRVAERRSKTRLLIDRATCGLTNCQVCVSSAVRDFMIQSAKLPADRLVVIPNGVQVERFDNAQPVDLSSLAAGGNCAVLVCIGRLDRQKGLDDLLDALEMLAARQPLADQLRVVLLGDGPLKGHLQVRIARAKLEQIVHLAGWQSNPQDWLAACDGLVLPSRWEGMPNVVLEAMAARKPVIATAVEGTAELVRQGETGWLSVPGNPESLAADIATFLSHRELWQPFGVAGRALVERQFTYDRMVDQYEELYRRLLGLAAIVK